MSNRWLLRIFLGLPLNERDFDDLIRAVPELLQNDIPLPPLFLFLHWYIWEESESYFKELQDRWRTAIHDARVRANSFQERAGMIPNVVINAQECPHPDCPLRQGPPPQTLESETQPSKSDDSEELTLYRMVVMAHGQAPKKQFLNMAKHLSGRIKKGVKRVIVTDPYVHCDKAEDGTYSGYSTLFDFLSALGLNENHEFTLELTPAPKGGTDGQPLKDTSLGSALCTNFPRIILKHHKPCKGGFHDRFYLTVDGSGGWDGLFGPSLNGLDSQAIVLIGELKKDSPAKKNLKHLLD